MRARCCWATRGPGKPETFEYIGFTHICAKTTAGRFQLNRVTISRRMRARFGEVKDRQIKRRQYGPIPDQRR